MKEWRARFRSAAALNGQSIIANCVYTYILYTIIVGQFPWPECANTLRYRSIKRLIWTARYWRDNSSPAAVRLCAPRAYLRQLSYRFIYFFMRCRSVVITYVPLPIKVPVRILLNFVDFFIWERSLSTGFVRSRIWSNIFLCEQYSILLDVELRFRM